MLPASSHKMHEEMSDRITVSVEDSASTDAGDSSASDKHEQEQDSRERLSKRLAYLLRYGARKEGLQVDDLGYVDFKELMTVPLLCQHSEAQILEEIQNSCSHRGSKRFSLRNDSERVLVRAAYGRNMEKSPCHERCYVHTLFERSMQTILDNLEDYDFQEFPDEYLIMSMLRRLKRTKKLNSSKLKVLLVPAVEHLDLEDVYLTRNILNIVYTQCPHLKSLSLRNCGYIITDSVLAQLCKKLPNLDFLNLTGCSHLTDKSVKPIVKHLPKLRALGLSFNKGITEAGVIELLETAPSLKRLDVYTLKTTPEGRQRIHELRSQQRIVVILNGLEEQDEDGNCVHIQPVYPRGMK